jgi:hypothetical protein
MFRPFIWPSSRRRVANDGYIEISQKFPNQCTDVKYYILKTRGILQTTYMYNSLHTGINHKFLPVFWTLVYILSRVSITVQQDATTYSLFSFCELLYMFGASSGAHITVIKASGTDQTVSATFRCCGEVGTRKLHISRNSSSICHSIRL